MRVVIVGYGMAGSRLARTLGKHGIEVVVFGDEPQPAYNRILLSGLLAGKQTEADLAFPAPGDNVALRLGEPATDIDARARTVNGVGYDALVLATGADALIPPVAGLRPLPDAAAVFRTVADCRKILAAARDRATAVVLGGGLLGLEAARGLAGRGLQVTVVHAATHLMERQLDPAGAAVLADTLTDLGVATMVDAMATEVAVTDDGVDIRLADDRRVTADMLVVSCGVTPNIRLARDAGLAVNRGVIIDDECRTGDPAIFAIGDCAEHRGRNYGLVAPAWEQADVVADVLTGTAASYDGSRLVTRLKAGGIDLAAMGELAGDEEVSFHDPVRGTYARLVISADRLTGAVLVGDNPTVGQVVQLYDRDDPVPPDRRSLLLGRSIGASPTAHTSPSALPDDAMVCRCNTVDKAELVDAWRRGARSVPQLADATMATTGCGGCTGDVSGICGWLNGTEAVQAETLTEVAA